MRTDFVIVDLETTGLNPESDQVIQIAMLREMGTQTDTLAFLLIRIGRFQHL